MQPKKTESKYYGYPRSSIKTESKYYGYPWSSINVEVKYNEFCNLVAVAELEEPLFVNAIRVK